MQRPASPHRSLSALVAVLAFLGFVAPAAFGQSAEVDRLGERRNVAVVVRSLEEADNVVTTRVLFASLSDFLAEYDLVQVNPTPDSIVVAGIDTGERRVSAILGSLDGGEGANLVVGAFYFVDANQLFVQFVLYDPVIDTVLGGILTRARQGLTIFAGVESALSDFRPVIERFIAGGYYAAEPEGIVESVTVRGAVQGARVLFVDRVVGEVSRGELLVPYVQYEIGSDIRVEATRDGYHPITDVVTLEDANSVVSLPVMQRETRFDLGVRWTYGLSRGAGVAARLHVIPDTLFVSFEHYRLFEPAVDSDATDVQTYDYNVSVGRYLIFGHRSPIRLHVGLGFGVYVSDVDDLEGREFVDWYALIGDPTVELNLRRVAVFARPDLRYALGIGYNTQGRVWVRTPFGLPPISVGTRLSW